MHITIKATNIELTDAIRQYTESKVSSLSGKIKGGDSSAEARVEVGKTTNHHQKGDIFRAEIDILISGGARRLRAVAERDDLYVAIDEAREEMERELVQFKDKRQAIFKRGARTLKNLLKRFWI